MQLYPLPSTAIAAVVRYGYLGVELFFLISGFVIASSAENQSWQSFMWGRFSRLFPLFWVCCTITWAGVLLLHGGPAIERSVLTYLANMGMALPHLTRTAWVDGSYWTLGYEWYFYVCVALLLKTNHFEKHLSKYLAGWLVVSLTVLVGLKGHNGIRLATLAEYAPYFVAGACFNKLYKGKATILDIYNLSFAYLVAMKSCSLHAEEMWVKYQNGLSPTIASTLVSIFFALFLLLSLRKLEFLNRKMFLRFGVLTYSFYLIHQFLGYSVIAKLYPHLGIPLAMLTAVGFSLGLAFVLHKLVEQPTGSWLKAKRPVYCKIKNNGPCFP